MSFGASYPQPALWPPSSRSALPCRNRHNSSVETGGCRRQAAFLIQINLLPPSVATLSPRMKLRYFESQPARPESKLRPAQPGGRRKEEEGRRKEEGGRRKEEGVDENQEDRSTECGLIVLH
jgi:hypothetical protein